MTLQEFNRTVDPLLGKMLGLARRLLRDPDDAADALQEALLKLWRSQAPLPDMERPDAYCLKAVRMQCLDMLERRRELSRLDEAAELPSAEAPPDSPAGETRQLLLRIIATLPEAQQRIVRLIVLGGLTPEEAAQITGLTPANVRQLLSRGRRKIKILFNKNY